MKNMGDIISYQRREKGMTQADLAAKMNVTDKAVSKWERNLSCPDVNSIPKLAELLGVSVDELLTAKKADEQKSKGGKIINIILKAVPLAMGVAVAILSIQNKIDTRNALIMLGVGLACLSAGSLNDHDQ